MKKAAVCDYGVVLIKGVIQKCMAFFMFARHGRTLTGESPEHAQIVGSV